MSLTVTRTPGDQNLVKNPVVFEMTTDNEFSTDGVVVRQSVAFDQVPADGDTLTLQWLNGARDLVFTFRNSPNDSGLELDRSGAHANVASYIQNLLLSELRSNYLLNKDFIMSYQAPDEVVFEARVPGVSYAFTLDSSGVYNAVLDVFQSGVDPVIRENFRVVAELAARYVGDTEWEKAELELIPVDGEVIFDFQHLLSSFDKVVLPALNASSPVNASAQIIEFETRFAEAFGTTLSVQRSLQYAVKYGIYGGFNLRDRLGFNFEGTVLPEFLTHRNVVHLREGQPFFFAFWNDNSVKIDAQFRADLTYTDGTTATKTMYTQTLGAYSLYLFPVSAARLAAVADVGKTVQKALVKVNGGNFGTTVNIDRSNVKDQTIIAYRNAFGVLETECFTGEVLKTFETKHQTADLYRRWDDAYQEPRIVTYQGQQIYGLELNSGWFSKDRAELLADLLSSDRHYLVLNNKYLPVRLSADTWEVAQTLRGSFNSFNLKLTFIEDQNFSDVGDRIG